MTTQMAELVHTIQIEHERLAAAQKRLQDDIWALHDDMVKQCLRAGLPPHIHSAEHLADRVLKLQKLLATSERLRKLEAQAVANAIRDPDGPLRVPRDLICALRGVTLPEDFLPAVERICAENDRFQAVVEAARVAVERMGEKAGGGIHLHSATCRLVDWTAHSYHCNCNVPENMFEARRVLGL